MRNSRQNSLLLTAVMLSTFAAIVASCVDSTSGAMPRGTVVVDVLYPAPILGVVIDEDRVVVDIIPNSVADKANIQRGDVILKVNDIPITDRRQPRTMVHELSRDRSVDDPATLNLILQRDGEEIAMQVRLELPPERPDRREAPRTPIPDDKTFF